MMTSGYGNRQRRRGVDGVAAVVLALALGVAGAAPLSGGSGPVIASVEPEGGPAGTEVVIRGENFGSAIGALQGTSGVSFGGVWASPSWWSEGEVRVAVPAGAESGPVVVTVGGVASQGAAFTVTGAASMGPAIGTVSPVLGPEGTEVVIKGTGFGEASETGRVSFNGIEAVASSWSEGEIRVLVPEGAESGPVAVTVNGVVGNGEAFTVTPEGAGAPVIASLSPEAAPAGTEVVIRGKHFGEASETGGVSFSGVWAEPSYWSEEEIRVPVPGGAPSGQVAVTVGGEASGGVAFAVTGPAPVIETVDPTHGPEGTGVVIRGVNFGAPIGAVQGSSGVSFNGVWGVPTSWSEGEIRVRLPEGVESGLVVVTVGARASNGVDFTVTAGGKQQPVAGKAHALIAEARATTHRPTEEEDGPEIDSLTPDSGPVGTSVKVAGRGFGAAQGTSTVSFNGAEGVPTSWSATGIEVPVPAGATTGLVAVTVGERSSNGVRFNVGPSIGLTVEESQVQEPDGALTLQVRLFSEQPSTAPVTVDFSMGGTARLGVDYTLGETVTIPAGGDEGSLLLTVIDDEQSEGAETITIQATAEGYLASPLLELTLLDNEPPPLRLSLDRDSLSERSGERTATLTLSVAAEAVSATPVTVSLHHPMGGTASNRAPTADYALARSVTLPGGASEVTTTLEVLDDITHEPEETLSVYASAPGYGNSPTRTVAIVPDDDLPKPILTIDRERVSEREGQRTATLTATLPGEAPEADVTLSLSYVGSSSAQYGIDYACEPTRIVVRAGENSGTATLRVIDDAVHEGRETFGLSVYDRARPQVYGFSKRLSVTIEDDDPGRLTIGIDPDSVGEAEGKRSSRVTVSLEKAVEEKTWVTLTFGGTATRGREEDYTLAERLLISNGRTSTSRVLEVWDDADYEGDETIRIQASAPGYETTEVVEIPLIDDDPGKPTIEVDPDSVGEAEGERMATVRVSLPERAGVLTLVTITFDGTARGPHADGPGPQDYRMPDELLLRGDMTSGTLNLEVLDDTVHEGEETIILQASVPNYEDYMPSDPVEIPLIDDDLPMLRVEVDRDSVGEWEAEGERMATVTVSVPSPVTAADGLMVTLRLRGTADRGANHDYTLSKRLTIMDGKTSVSRQLRVVDDMKFEEAETVEITAMADPNLYKDSDPVSVTIEDDDTPLTLAVTPDSISEPNGTATVTVSVPEPVDAPLTVTLTHPGMEADRAAPGEDYTLASTVTIDEGNTLAEVTLAVTDDEVYEGDETVEIRAAAHRHKDSDTVPLTIEDDDAPITLTVTPDSLSEPDGTATVTVSVPEPVDAPLTVTLEREGADRSEYTLDPTVTISTGETLAEVTLAVTDDEIYEEDKTLEIRATADGYKPSRKVPVTLESEDQPEILLSCPSTLQESAGTVEIDLILSVAAPANTLFTFSFKETSDIYATRGQDYTMDTALTISESRFGAASLTVIDDRRYEGDETIDLEVSAEGYQTAFCVFKIKADPNDPMEPPLTLEVTPSTVSEEAGKAQGHRNGQRGARGAGGYHRHPPSLRDG